VFVADVAAPALHGDDAHHLGRVLRLRDGEQVTVADGRGAWRCCEFTSGAVIPAGEIETCVAPAPPIVIGFALTKGDKPELVVQKLTELGVDRIVPLLAERSVVQWDTAKAQRNAERLRAVARSAAMQSRRVFLPVVEAVTAVADFAAATPGLGLAHPEGGPLSRGTSALAIGPEGGWTDAELSLVPGRVDLGNTTLRAETAAVAAGVLLTALRDGRVRAEGSS
jgi:16S rRNA (uracil1498-N3)-methyltransferase